MTIAQLKNISLTFSGATKAALSRISYDIKKGDFVILLGSNGSGKSSLLKILHRHHQPNAGKIDLLGKPINHYQAKELSSVVTSLTQNCDNSFFVSLTLYENYLLAKASHSFFTYHKNEREFLQNYLAEYNPNLAHKLDCTIDQFSGGEKQALALAFCMLKVPTLLLLDEHTSALDPKTSKQIMSLTHKIVTQKNITCVLTTHDLDIALEYGNRILLLREGEIYKTIDNEAKHSLSKEMLIKMYC